MNSMSNVNEKLSILLKFCIIASLSSLLLPPESGRLLAWDRGTVAYSGTGAVSVEPLLPDRDQYLIPRSDGAPVLRLRLESSLRRDLDGAFIYVGLTDFTGNGVQDFERRIDLPAGGSLVEEFTVPELEGRPGFYDARVLVFDRGRESGAHEFSFGYDVDNLPPDYDPPADFDRFWRLTLDSLAAVPLAATVMHDTLRSTGMVDVYRISFASLHNVRVHGWYTLPAWKEGPHPALAFYPGYSSGRISPPAEASRQGYAAVAIQVRGYGVDRESYPEDNRRYMDIGIESPETYIYREIVCHCIRAVDFLASRPEVDHGRLAVSGGSQGGGLSLLVAGLDSRITAAAANVPFLTHFPLSMTMTGSPYRDVVRYIDDHPGSRERVLRTVSYFDTMSLARLIKVPVIMSAGLFDRTCPAPSIYRLYLSLGSKDKSIRLYPYLDHLEVGRPFGPVRARWMQEHFPAVPPEQ